MNQKIYNYEDVLNNTIKYFNGDELAAKVWVDKYCLKNDKGELLEYSPDDMHNRMAEEFARIEENYYSQSKEYDVNNLSDYGKKIKKLTKEDILEYFKNFKYIVPQGSVMASLGNNYNYSSLSNCVVVPEIYDSYGGIMYTDQQLVQLMKRRCGVGISLDTLRPSNSVVNNSAGTSTGAVSFMERFSNTTREVAQCLHEDTKVLTSKGLKDIKNINIGDDGWTKVGYVKVLNKLQNKKPLKEITTMYGNKLICSEDHIIHTLDGEKQVKELKNSDIISCIIGNGWQGEDIILNDTTYERMGNNNSNRLNDDVILPIILNEDFAYFLGYFYGDGYVSENEINLSVSNYDHFDIINKLQTIIKSEFNYDAIVSDKNKYGKYKIIRIFSKKLINYLIENKICKEKSKDIKFPEILMGSKKEILFSFIAGYFDADGCSQISKKVYKISSVNNDFLLKIQNILYSFGVISNIHKYVRNNENWNDLYTIVINGKRSQDIFKDLMVNSIKIENKKFESKKRDFHRTIYKTDYFNTKSSKHPYIMDNNQYLSYTTSNRLKEEINSDLMITLIQDKIKNIENYDNGNRHSTYDLVLEKEHLFFANGIYVHNSGRRGALMQSMNVRHPNIEDFIEIKNDLSKVTGANISVKITDEFMEAVKNDTEFTLQFPIDSENPTVTKVVKAKDIWNKIVKSNWKCLPYDSELFVWVNGERRLMKIGDLVENRNDNNIYQVLSLNLNNLKTEIKNVEDFQKYKNDKIIYTLITKNNDKLSLTQDHIIYRLNNKGELENVEIKDIRIGDNIVKSKKVNHENNYIHDDYIDLSSNIEFFENLGGYHIWWEGIEYFLEDSDVIEQLGSYDNGYKKSTMYKKLSYITVGDYIKLLENGFITEDIKTNLFIIPSREKLKYNINYKVSENFLKFLGLWLAEGSMNYSGSITLHVNTKEVNEYMVVIEKLSEEFNFNYSTETIDNYTKINIVSMFLTNILLYIGIKNRNQVKKIPEFIFSLNLNNISHFLNGFFCGDGYISKRDGNINVSQSNFDVLNDVKSLLLLFGIHSKIRKTCHKGLKKINNKLCNVKESYVLSIHKKYNRIFLDNIRLILNEKHNKISSNSIIDKDSIFNYFNFSNYRKYYHKNIQHKNKNILENVIKLQDSDIIFDKVINIEKDIIKTNYVYDITVEDNHTFVLSNSIVVSNSAEPGLLFWDRQHWYSTSSVYPKYLNISTNPCAEIAMGGGDSCRLISLNMFGCVENPFTKEAKFNFDKWYEVTYVGQRLNDDLVDLELESIERILEKSKNDPEPDYIKDVEKRTWELLYKTGKEGRRTGLGFTALGDVLAALNLRYDTDEAISVIELIMKTKAEAEFDSSIDMAIERGVFDGFDPKIEETSEFVQMLKKELPNVYKRMMKFGRRNVSISTVAPVGCMVENTVIQTDNGDVTLKDLFLLNDIDIDLLKGTRNIWIDVESDIFVYNFNGKKNKINKLYWNGLTKNKIIRYSDDSKTESSLEHKFLVKISDKEAIWKKTEDLKIGDKIIKLKNRKISQ